MAKSSSDIQRLLTLLAFLNQRKGRKIDQVAAELGVTRRQLMADMEKLCLCGVPPFEPDDLFMFTVDENDALDVAFAGQFKAPLHLTPDEALALRLAMAPLLAGSPGSYPSLVRGIIGKIDGALLPQDRLAVSQLDGKTVVQAGDEETAQKLEVLRLARRKRQRVEAVYYSGSSGELAQRRFDPYGFLLFGGGWYTVALCRRSNQIRKFKVERIRELRLTGESYDIPEDFDITGYAAGHIFKPAGTEKTVRVWFSKKVARWILERSREARRNRDGSAEMTIRANSFAWIARWVLQYGPEAKILEPAEARQEVVKILDRALI